MRLFSFAVGSNALPLPEYAPSLQGPLAYLRFLITSLLRFAA